MLHQDDDTKSRNKFGNNCGYFHLVHDGRQAAAFLIDGGDGMDSIGIIPIYPFLRFYIMVCCTDAIER